MIIHLYFLPGVSILKLFTKFSKKKIILTGALAVLVIICLIITYLLLRSPRNIGDLAYSPFRPSPERHTVYILENDTYEPYLVLENNYNGSGGTLLLRQYLWEQDKHIQYGEKGSLGYYPDNLVEAYLHETYLPVLTELQNSVLVTPIEVASYESRMKSNLRTTEMIERQVFLLSVTELGVPHRVNDLLSCIEGKPLRYYKGQKTFPATFKDGGQWEYWTRTATFSNTSSDMACMILYDGICTGNWAASAFAVRPAFCLSPDTPIERAEVNGEKVYIISTQTAAE